MAQFDVLVNKLLSDASFAEALVADPEGTLRSNGIDPTPEMVTALRQLDPSSVARLATAFGQQAAASAS